MDRLNKLKDYGTQTSAETEAQANKIASLFNEASLMGRTSIVFTLVENKAIDPLVLSVLTMKGYQVSQIPFVGGAQMGTTSYTISPATSS